MTKTGLNRVGIHKMDYVKSEKVKSMLGERPVGWGAKARAMAKDAKGFAMWLGLVGAAVSLAWRIGSTPVDSSFERVQKKAAAAVEMELGGKATLSELSLAMTEEAAKKALADRSISGLEKALSSPGSAIKATATPIAVEKTDLGWDVKGSAVAAWISPGAVTQAEPWRGEWTASLVLEAPGELRVSKLSIASQDVSGSPAP